MKLRMIALVLVVMVCPVVAKDENLASAVATKIEVLAGSSDWDAFQQVADFILDALQKQPEILLGPDRTKKLELYAPFFAKYLIDAPAKKGDFKLAFLATMFLLDNFPMLYSIGEYVPYGYMKEIIVKQHLLQHYRGHKDLLELYWGTRDKAEVVGDSAERKLLHDFILIRKTIYTPTPESHDVIVKFLSECSDEVFKVYLQNELPRICYRLGVENQRSKNLGLTKKYFAEMLTMPPMYGYKTSSYYKRVAKFFLDQGDEDAAEAALKKGIESYGSPSAHETLLDFYNVHGEGEDYFDYVRASTLQTRRVGGYHWKYDPKRYNR